MNFCNVAVNTSVVTQAPSVKLSLKVPYFAIIPSTSIPKCLAVAFNSSWNISPPIPALTTEFQSCNDTLPAANACDNWYIAVETCCDVEPEMAPKFAIPLIAPVDVVKSTPAAVNVPMFLVISVKL